MSDGRVIHIENHIYEWREALKNKSSGVSFFRVYLVDELGGDMGKICIWTRRVTKDKWFESVHREILQQHLCGKDVLVFRLELDNEGAYCVSTKDFGDPYGFIMDKARENNLDVMGMSAADNHVRVSCVSDRTAPWEILEDGLVRRGLFLRDFGFDQYDRVVVTCGKARK